MGHLLTFKGFRLLHHAQLPIGEMEELVLGFIFHQHALDFNLLIHYGLDDHHYRFELSFCDGSKSVPIGSRFDYID